MPTLLVFGRSNALGHGLADPGRAWPCVLGELIEARTGDPVTVERKFLRMEGDPTDYLGRVFAETQPDVVSVSVSPYDYASLHVQSRLNERVGKRVGDAARWLEKKMQPDGSVKKPHLLHRSIRRVARRFIGSAPQRTRTEVEFTLEQTFRFLAQQEDVAVVMRTEGGAARVLVEGNPDYARVAAEFAARWKRKAAERHFHWTDYDTDGGEEPHRLGDGLHMNEAGHARRAADLEGAIFEALCDVRPEYRSKDRPRTRELTAPA